MVGVKGQPPWRWWGEGGGERPLRGDCDRDCMEVVSFCLSVVSGVGGVGCNAEVSLLLLLLLLFWEAWWVVEGDESTGMSILLAALGVVTTTVMKNHTNNMTISEPTTHLAMEDDAMRCCLPFLAQVGNCADLIVDQQC